MSMGRPITSRFSGGMSRMGSNAPPSRARTGAQTIGTEPANREDTGCQVEVSRALVDALYPLLTYQGASNTHWRRRGELTAVLTTTTPDSLPTGPSPQIEYSQVSQGIPQPARFLQARGRGLLLASCS
jgi:hypothetical protein